MKCYTVIFPTNSANFTVRDSIWVNAKNEVLGIKNRLGYVWNSYSTEAGTYLTNAYLRHEKLYGVGEEIGNVYDEVYFVKPDEANINGILLYIILPTYFFRNLVRKTDLRVIDTKFSSSQEARKEFINITAIFNGTIDEFTAIVEGAL